MLRFSISAILLPAVLFLSGCDSEPDRYEIGGEVTYKGAPIKLGTISFRSDGGQTGAAQIVNGKYSLPAIGGLPEGNYRVAISYPDPKIAAPSGNELPGEPLPNRELLPRKYNTDTELTTEIKSDGSAKQLNFKLD
jgi:hypothetical protein